MMEKYHNHKFCSWNLDISIFQKNSTFIKSIFDKLNNFDYEKKPDSANGFAYSTTIFKNKSIENGIDGFDEFLKFIEPSLNTHLKELGGVVEKEIVSCWANRMHKNSFGTVHSHPSVDYVLLFYHKVPTNSSDLIFINPKYKFKSTIMPQETFEIPETDCRRIKVSEGLCILHQGNMLHTVSMHKNDEPREVIVLEFKLGRVAERLKAFFY